MVVMFFILRWCIRRSHSAKSIDTVQEPQERDFGNYGVSRRATEINSAARQISRQTERLDVAENNNIDNGPSPGPIYNARMNSATSLPINTQYQRLSGISSPSTPEYIASPLFHRNPIPTQTYSDVSRFYSTSPGPPTPLEQRSEPRRSIRDSGISAELGPPPTPPLRNPRRAPGQFALTRKPTTLCVVQKPTAQQPVQIPNTFLQASNVDSLKRSDTGYSSHYGDSPDVSRRGSRREPETMIDEQDGWRYSVPGIDPAVLYGDIMASSPFARDEAWETRQECVGILTAAAKRKRVGNATAAHNFPNVNPVRQIRGQEEVDSRRTETKVEVESGMERRNQVDIDTLVSLPPPLRVVKRGKTIEVPVLRFPRPLSLEQRRGRGRTYAVSKAWPFDDSVPSIERMKRR